MLKYALLSLLFTSMSAMARIDLWSDDFERSNLNGGPQKYTVTPIGSRGEAGIGTYIANSGSRSMFICCDEVYVTSDPMDLSASNYAEVNFWLRSGSDNYSEWPSSSDDLRLDVLLDNGSWQALQLWEGGGSLGGDTYNVYARIPVAGLHSNFRFRFYQADGSGSSFTRRDFWHIDDLKVTDFEVGTTRYPLFEDQFERNFLLSPPPGGTLPDWYVTIFDGNFTSQISNHTAETGTRSMFTCCGERTTTTRSIDLSGETFVELEYWIRYGDDNFSGTDAITPGNYDSEDPSAAELYVQIYLPDGTWRTIDFHDPSASNSGEIYRYEARVPDDALHSNFRLRFYQADGTTSLFRRYDFYHIDNVYVGTRDDTSSAVHHFRLSYNSAALTCNPQDVTIQVCEDASCSGLYTDPVDIVLSPTGWVGGNAVTITGGSGVASLARTTAGTVDLDVVSSIPLMTGSNNRCSIDGGPYTPSCSLTFADSGFLVDVPDIIAGKGTAAATIQAVRKSDNAPQCVPAFANVTKNVDFWTSYDIPASGSMVTSMGGVAVSGNNLLPTTLSLNFDSNGEAVLPSLNYYDAGQKSLYARYVGTGADLGLIMEGSDPYIARPAGLCVDTGSSCTSGAATCGVFGTAGAPFPVSITAVAWESDSDSDFCSDNSGTPNYNSGGNITLSSNLLAPIPGNPGVTEPTEYNHLSSNGTGGENVVSMTQSEVGVFTFSATPPLYLGAALGSTSSTTPVTYTSQPTGRFIPDHFEVSASDVGEFSPACPTGNTYTGQSFDWLIAPTIAITAFNGASPKAVTENYTHDDFRRLAAANVADNITYPTEDNATDGNDGSRMQLSGVPDTQFNDGSISVSGAGQMEYVFSAADSLAYLRNSAAEINTFSPDLVFEIGSAISDGEANVNNTVNFTPDGSSVDVRFGRMIVEDSYGPENSNLTLPMSMEYFADGEYVLNTFDSCSTWNSANASVDSLSSILPGSGAVSSGTTGSNGLELAAPTTVAGTPDTGDATVIYDAPFWLEGDFNGDGNFNNDPSATSTFGVYRGHERVIYKKELR